VFYDPSMRIAWGIAACASIVFATSRSNADPPWIERRQTLPQGEFGVDVGVGIADDARDRVVGTGAYLQVNYGITDRIEVSVRDGVRFGKFGQYSRADQYGRLYTTDGEDTPAPGLVGNPDLVLYFRFLDLGFLEIGAEAEVGFPVEPNTRTSTTAGVALTLHYAPWLRFDTGAYLSTAFYAPVQADYVFPFELWSQAGKFPLWYGLLTAVQTFDGSSTVVVPLGLGVGYALTKNIDLRAEALIPQINVTPGVRDMGFGAGGEVRF
jgi:hypothetical protein